MKIWGCNRSASTTLIIVFNAVDTIINMSECWGEEKSWFETLQLAGSCKLFFPLLALIHLSVLSGSKDNEEHRLQLLVFYFCLVHKVYRFPFNPWNAMVLWFLFWLLGAANFLFSWIGSFLPWFSFWNFGYLIFRNCTEPISDRSN